MLVRILNALTIVIAILSTTVDSANAWGKDGHRIIARIAFNLLPQQKAEMIDDLLRNSDLGRDFVEASLYADWTIRPQDYGKVFDTWHYVNWTITEPYFDKFCQPTCIITELPELIQKAKTASGTGASDRNLRAWAVSWVLHGIADLHQPMHVGDNRDSGGVDFHVKYRGRERCGTAPNDIDITNLHRAWDYCLVYELETGRDWRRVADDIRGSLTTYKGHPAAAGDHVEWARQAHELARDVAYRGVQHDGNIEQPYIDQATPVVREQLLRAGIRLAKVLDEVF